MSEENHKETNLKFLYIDLDQTVNQSELPNHIKQRILKGVKDIALASYDLGFSEGAK